MPWYNDYFDTATIKLYRTILPAVLAETEAKCIPTLLELPPGAAIVDICCGYGRHLLPLRRQGYDVVGIDISFTALREAIKEARSQDMMIRVNQSDMRHIPFSSHFDAAILMFNSFGIFSEDHDNLQTLTAIARVLKIGGNLLLEIPNRVYYEELRQEYSKSGTIQMNEAIVSFSSHLNNKTNIMKTELRWTDDSGSHVARHAVRLYTMQEIARMSAKCGLVEPQFYSDLQGNNYDGHQERMLVR